MNLTEISRQLNRLFAAPPRQGAVRNIVFWYDEAESFSEDIDGLNLENAKLLKLYDNNMFATKLYIEETDKTSNLLVYSPMPRPDNRENWLTDTIKYSQVFSTDEASLHLLNFGIDHSLRHVVEKYKSFFKNNDRARRFESYHLAPYTETKIDVAVLSVLCKLSAPNIDNITRCLLIELSKGESAIYDSIAKFGNLDALWGILAKSYCGNDKDKDAKASVIFKEQSLDKLAVMLFATHTAHSLNGKTPAAWMDYLSTNTNCVVFMDNLLKNTDFFEDYKILADFVADKLGVQSAISSLQVDDCMDCDTFDLFDSSIILRICENISMGVGEYEKYRRIINHRRNKRFFGEFETEYTALLYACEFHMLCEKYKELRGNSAGELFDKYVSNYYKIDTSYRNFILYSDRLEHSKNTMELLQNEGYLALSAKIENLYTNWYLNELSGKWCNYLDDMDSWILPGVTPLQNFYDKNVSPFVRDNERIVVIISDALRYESAMELTDLLNVAQKGSAELSTMLGVIPSYTKLGMAALLPHKEIIVTEKAEILVDGMSTQGTENREKILLKYKAEAVAITYDSVMTLAKERGKLAEKFNGMKLIYIYHNTIDARGDNASTEREVFDATEKCFAELSALIKTLKNNISAINFFITADHGYIYKRTPLAESDKTPKDFTDIIEGKRRFFITKEPADIQGTQCFSMDYLKGTSERYAVIPRITNCYKVQGAGSSYVHGGTSLQEVVVPVIKFKSDKNSTKSQAAKKVSISLTNLARRLTSVITHLSFFQNEKVEDKLLPIRIKAYFIDDTGGRISNENIIIAESTSINPEDRTYKEKFTLKNIPYDKTKEYYLVLEDEEEMVNKIIEKIPFTIDLVFGGIKF